ncbi:hypothetical protein A3224_00530 [Microbulbifer thermotolerans]|uniref:Uncharacterized protein n=1 Tax=Microbulbifer thermotolerans TaxID=252514 RepID=A0A143HHS2_MICTH|nr:hypothetical protein A3224_00530 [Microbulbifer thermotolerans]
MQGQVEILKNLKVTLIALILIAACHFGGVFGIFFWFGGLFVIPAIAMFFQYRYLSGGSIQKIILAALPWSLYSLSGLVAVQAIEHEGAQTMNQTYYSAPLYSAIIGSIVLGVWASYKGYLNERQQ